MSSSDGAIHGAIQNALNTAYESDTDLPANEKPSRGSIAARTFKLESTVRYLGIEVDDALELSEQTEI